MIDQREAIRKATFPPSIKASPSAKVASSALKGVLSAIASRSGGKGKCTATEKTLAGDTGYSVKTVKRSLKILRGLKIVDSYRFRQGRSDRCERRINVAGLQQFSVSLEESTQLCLEWESRFFQGGTDVPVTSSVTGTSRSHSQGRADQFRGASCTPKVKEKIKVKTNTTPIPPKDEILRDVGSLFAELVAGDFSNIEKGNGFVSKLMKAGIISEQHKLHALAAWIRCGQESSTTDFRAIHHPVAAFEKWVTESNWKYVTQADLRAAEAALNSPPNLEELEHRWGSILDSMTKPELLQLVKDDRTTESLMEIGGPRVHKLESVRRVLLLKLERQFQSQRQAS